MGPNLVSATVDHTDTEAKHAEQSRNEHQPDRSDRPDRELERPRYTEDRKRDEPDRGDGDHKDEDRKPRSRWPLIILGIVVVLAIIAGTLYWFMTRGLESTDDAYTEGNAIAFAAKISGYVTQLNVDDNTFVHAGDLMVKIDPRDYITARDQARASLSLARAELASAQVDLAIARVRIPATLQQAQAQLAQAQANQAQAEQDYRRIHAVDPRATTQTNIDQANAQLKSNTAAVSNAQAQIQIASLVQQNIEAAEDTVKQRQAQVAQAEANLAQAEVNLSVHRFDGATGRLHHAPQRRSRHVRPGGAADLLHRHAAGLGHRELQGNPACRHAARATRDDECRCVSAACAGRSRGQHPGWQRRAVLGVSCRECDRQFRENRSPRAGQDHHRPRAGKSARAAARRLRGRQRLPCDERHAMARDDGNRGRTPG